jgi:hypothetical protein
MGQFGVSTMLGVGYFPAYGEPGHEFRMRERPTADKPLRAIVGFPNGRAVFDSPEEALEYLEHPGDVQHAARFYLSAHGIEVPA